MNGERLIRFPWPSQADSPRSSVRAPAYCVAYQHDVDPNGYGPYGFNTERSQLILGNALGELHTLQKSAGSEAWSLAREDAARKHPLYLYGEASQMADLKRELACFYATAAKNSIRARHALPVEVMPDRPVLLQVLMGGECPIDVLEKLMASGCGAFLRQNSAPEAGDVFVFLSTAAWSRLRWNALRHQVDGMEAASIHELKPW